jgi:hypothetical protein
MAALRSSGVVLGVALFDPHAELAEKIATRAINE